MELHGSFVARSRVMLLIIAALLAAGWVLGFAVFQVASVAIHILIAAAVVVAIMHFATGASKR